MRLIRCHIENFGKLHNYDHDFSDGIDIICEENGWGKTTLATFIRVMFFGFAGDGKQKESENERKHYAPWQSGMYGGNLVFENDGKEYRIERTFGEKKSGTDTYVLYDNKTRLESHDFSTDIGEELFKINAESFMNTVFISQSTCETEATAGISAKIGNVAESGDDMGRYEKVYAKMTDELNSLSPSRKTGEIKKTLVRISELEAAIRNRATTETSANMIEERIKGLKVELDDRKARRKKLSDKVATVSKYNENKGAVREYAILKDNYDAASKKAEEEKAYFPAEVPADADVAEMIGMCSEADRERQSEANFKLSEEEKAMLDKYGDKLSDGKPDAAKISPLVIIGGVLLVAGIVLLVLSYVIPGVALAVFGIVIAAIGFVNMSRQSKLNEIAVRLSDVKKKSENYNNAKSKADEYEKKVGSYLDSYGYKAEPSEYRQLLTEIRQHIYTYSMAVKEKEQQERTLRIFEESHDMTKIMVTVDGYEDARTDNTEDIQSDSQDTRAESVEKLNADIYMIDQEIERTDESIKAYSRQLESLCRELETYDGYEVELSGLNEKREKLQRRYDILSKTREYLEKAKIKFTAKYMDPVQESFDKYYSYITEESETKDKTYELDANLGLSLVEAGTTHDIRLLSEGYRNMVGLCRRMSFIDAMFTEEAPFIIMDDPFESMDDEKMKGAMEFLKNISKSYQIIYLTCHSSRKPN